ncbi:hypothetical protein NQ315_010049 [Exocentrus adspersus]|uniref:Lysosomal Pro-X carboxypeptidase n=1 Tax=Exocentrus adspersus TaxID=1586481 RepID=A0AAV8WCP5_9CUCU|nr:hypothetical protein NQ315_010049 [Exocentrus adspersus]
MKIIVFLCFQLFSVILAENVKYSFETKYIDMPLDHFSFTSNKTFKLKYLVNDTFHVDNGPIFFYTGNEGSIEMFAQNTGFMFDIAPQFNALLVFAEHRYYGSSLPFGNLSYTSPKYLGYLSSTQALADYVYLINDLQHNYASNRHLKKLPVVAFGGSYGGMLSAWLRIKYPGSIVGAIASSAPIWQFKDLTPCENFYRVVTNVFEALGGKKCSETIRNSWSIIRALAANDAGKTQISKLWNLCTAIKTSDDIDKIVNWLLNIYINLAMVNYPYPTSFLVPLPANPVREFCGKINSFEYKDNIGLLKAIGEALTVYTNYTKTAKCNDIGGSMGAIGIQGWYFQACTEMIMPLCSNDLDMFEHAEWDFKKYSDDCFKQFGIRPRDENVPILEYGGKELGSASNIVFSNGLLDPWSSGGVLSNVSKKLVAVIIPDGAHHFDLRAANDLDTESVKLARLFHVQEIKKWLDKYYPNNLSVPTVTLKQKN